LLVSETKVTWNDNDYQNIAVSRGLALDVLSNAGSGHPGATLSLMPVLYLLIQKIMVHNPAEPDWICRDKLVLSCGHASLALYIQLHLAGYQISFEDLYHFRQVGSKTPGHPEYLITPGVETTTGPLGQGLSNAVGMALSEKIRNQQEKDNTKDTKVFCVVSDGDLQEGISFESASLASHYELDNLTVIFDSNGISIDGPVRQSTPINMEKYFLSLGWKVSHVSKMQSGEIDLQKLGEKVSEANDSKRPHLIILESEIGWPSPTYKNTSYIHGNLLPLSEIEEIKVILGFQSTDKLNFPSDTMAEIQKENSRRRINRNNWSQSLNTAKKINFEQIYRRIRETKFPQKISTRKANGIIIDEIKAIYPWTLGGSADLTESNGLSLSSLYTSNLISDKISNNLIFGVREHAMAAISNGLALDSQNIVYCATYLGFSDYQKPAVRLSALMQLPVVYLWTHDSIALGADGPTHQPIEHLAALRSIPDFAVIRPGSAEELKSVWIRILENRKPVGLILSRQDLINGEENTSYPQYAEKGAYIFNQNFVGDNPQVVVLATGSELELAASLVEATKLANFRLRIVSMTCWEWFLEESNSYQEAVIPADASLCVSIEAAASFGWQRFTGKNGLNIGIDTFGASGASNDLMEKFGFTPKAVESKILQRLKEIGLMHT
jgi:transketolase